MNNHQDFQTWLLSNPSALARLWACRDPGHFQHELLALGEEHGFSLDRTTILTWPSLNRRPRQR